MPLNRRCFFLGLSDFKLSTFSLSEMGSRLESSSSAMTSRSSSSPSRSEESLVDVRRLDSALSESLSVEEYRESEAGPEINSFKALKKSNFD